MNGQINTDEGEMKQTGVHRRHTQTDVVQSSGMER